MLKKSLIGLGIGVGVLALCLVLLTMGFLVGGAIAYFGTQSAAREASIRPLPEATAVPEESPQSPQQPWAWPVPTPGPREWSVPTPGPREWSVPTPGPREWPQSAWGLVQPALVTEVVEDSPAEESGVEVSDIIIGIDGTALDSDHDLAEIVRECDPGDEVVLTIIRRDGDTTILELEVTLGRERDEDGEIVAYLGLWYRPLVSGMGSMLPEGNAWD
jgi:membrane-associated protease RseP (regulator of RpoE activity)